MEELVGLCKRRGFIFPLLEIYGGYTGFFDYGPLGVELRNNIKQAWRRDFVHRRDDIEGLDSTIIMHPDIWKASGHVDGFSDPMVDCKETAALPGRPAFQCQRRARWRRCRLRRRARGRG